MRAGRRSRVRLHLAGAIAVPGCLAAGAFELSRALAGHELSWGYTFEWPVIAACVVWMWVRLAREHRAEEAGQSGHPPIAAPIPDLDARPETADPDLLAWQEYVEKLHAKDPPGGPTQRSGGG
jgi:hypothetical protein